MRVVGEGGVALVVAVAAAAMGELGEMEAEGERIRRNRSCRRQSNRS